MLSGVIFVHTISVYCDLLRLCDCRRLFYTSFLIVLNRFFHFNNFFSNFSSGTKLVIFMVFQVAQRISVEERFLLVPEPATETC